MFGFEEHCGNCRWANMVQRQMVGGRNQFEMPGNLLQESLCLASASHSLCIKYEGTGGLLAEASRTEGQLCKSRSHLTSRQAQREVRDRIEPRTPCLGGNTMIAGDENLTLFVLTPKYRVADVGWFRHCEWCGQRDGPVVGDCILDEKSRVRLWTSS